VTREVVTASGEDGNRHADAMSDGSGNEVNSSVPSSDPLS
jgi:hypothetical protein